MASETEKTLDQGDPEVSEAIDFLNYYAGLAERLDVADGARQIPVSLTVVTSPWNFPVAVPTGSSVAALAAGSAVIVKPAAQARRCGSMIVKALWNAGVPADVLRLVHVDEGELGRVLVADPRVSRLILTGAFETVELFRNFRPDLQLLGETSGKNSIIVTPQADRDLAVKGIAYSAFGHAGQKCSAASLAILIGSVATSARFREQFVDAVSSLKVGYPSDPSAQMGPLVEPATGKLLRALTQLSPGEEWLVGPKQLDDTGRLWSPGVKIGVGRGSEFHLTEYFGPVLGLISADSLEEAIEIHNELVFGLTAGLHSLARSEIDKWLGSVQAGRLYVNRGTAGAIVRRQPFGGWKKSAVGAGTKADGPNYLVGLSDWTSSPAAMSAPLSPTAQRILDCAVKLGLGVEDAAFLARSLGSDAAAWRDEFSTARDISGLDAERNWLRYLPVPATVRFEQAPIVALLRVVAAGLLAAAPVDVSTARPLGEEVTALLRSSGVEVKVDDTAAWSDRLGACSAIRVRLIGGSREVFAQDSGGRVDLKLYGQPVVEAGRIEMLTFLREQAVAATAHRFGSPSQLVEGLV
jgi:RHH-type proline utilization regulon transcriptional repressor/proline dehydrogenase/delta 1-pyrroline-5-carboxylate dehydrogenase